MANKEFPAASSWFTPYFFMVSGAIVVAGLGDATGGNPPKSEASPPAVASEGLNGASSNYADKSDLLYYLDPDGRRHKVSSIGDWQVRRGDILERFQSVAGPLPRHGRQAPPAVRYGKTDDLNTYLRVELTYEAEPGDHVPAYLLVPKDPNRRLPAVLCLHQTTPVGKKSPVGMEGDPDLHYAAELTERGYVTLVPDYPYLGENRFVPYDHGYISCTMKGIWNHIRAVDLLCSLQEVDPQRIGVIGHSLGGHNSIFVAVYDERIACVVSCCGYCTHGAYKEARKRLPWFGERYMPRLAEMTQEQLERSPFDMPEIIGCLAPRPFLTVAPMHDENFPLPGVKACICSAMPVYELYGAAEKLATDYPDAGHTFPKESREKAYAWFDRWLKASR
jgi:dienelactone hydrolase